MLGLGIRLGHLCWAMLGLCWATLEPPWGLCWASAHLGAMLQLGASGATLGRLGPSWRHVGPS